MPKISALPAVAELDGNEQVVLVQGGATRRGQIGGLVGATVGPYLVEAAASADAAALARDQAADLVIPANIFVDVPLATAEAAVANGTVFKLVDPASGLADVRRRTVGGSTLLYREATAAALGGINGETLIGADDGEGGARWSTLRGFITYLRSTAGATVLSFLQAGVGAVPRSLAAKLGDSVSVKDFGAVGDGAANDTVAIQKALDSGLGTINLTKGTYKTDALVVPDGVELIGRGKLSFTSGGLTLSGNNTLQGITIDGRNKAHGAHAIIVWDADNVLIDNVHFRQIARSAIDAVRANNLTVINCTAYEIGDKALINQTIEGCFFHSTLCTRLTINGNYRIERTHGHAAIFIRENNADCSVSDNAIYDTFFRGVQVYSLGHARLVISDNRIYRMGEINDTGSGVACNGIYVVTGSTDPSLVMISDNHIEKCAENGIEVLGAATVDNNVVKITGYRNLETPSKEGIFVEGGAIIRNNTVISAADKGIRHFNGGVVAMIVIDGNVIIDSASDGINLQVDGAGSAYVNCRISNNHVLSHGGAWAIAINGTNGATVDNSNAVSGNVIPIASAAFTPAGCRSFGNSWQIAA